MAKKFRRVLIANRGEIAVRIIRACHEMGLETVAVFSEADTKSLHVSLADYAMRIGPGPAASSYLKIDRVLDAAKESGADAVHPGYGLLSENGDFAEAVGKAGMTFIGPSPEAIRKMGNKTSAKDLMKKAKVPVVPGSDGPVENVDSALKLCEQIGFPILIKAVSGGGGRGMRIVEEAGKFKDAFESASREALGAFGDGRLYMERYIKNPRHVEIQVLADGHGNCVYLGERECSMQRRHQKIIEETPCVLLTPEMRREMGECAVKAALSVNYSGAGTVEFLVDEKKNFYFIEMNTRLQVEHPITELTYDVDLVCEQLRVAQGEKLRFKQSDLRARGAAIECRICAEDPENNYRPCPGQIAGIRFPGGPGVRFDTFVYDGYQIPVHYDPMIGKLITWGETRDIAVRRMEGALSELQIQGIKTNVRQLQGILAHPDFLRGNYHTNFLKEKHSEVVKGPQKGVKALQEGLEEIAAIAAALAEYQKKHSGVDAQSNSPGRKFSLSAWKLPTQSWKLTGLRRIMDRHP